MRHPHDRRRASAALAAALVGTLAAPPQALAFHGDPRARAGAAESRDERLPNYDIRTDAGEAARAALAEFRRASGRGATDVQFLRQGLTEGEAALRATLPNLVVEYNDDLRIPEVIGTDTLNAGFLTGPGRPAGQPHAPQLRAFMTEHQGIFGLRADQIAALRVVADYTNPDGNLSYVDLAQELNGRPVFRGEVRAMFTRDGRLARIVNNLAPHLDQSALPTDAVRVALDRRTDVLPDRARRGAPGLEGPAVGRGHGPLRDRGRRHGRAPVAQGHR